MFLRLGAIVSAAQSKADVESEEANCAAELAARQKAYQDQKSLETQKTTVANDKREVKAKIKKTKKKKKK
jgi:hypothetical protein